MWRGLHPEKSEPNGHPEIADTLNNMGVALMRQGKYEAAEDWHRQALAMRRRLYPKSQFPLGHIKIAKSLAELSSTFQLRGRTVEAAMCRKAAVEMASRLKTGQAIPRGRPEAAKVSFDGEEFFLAVAERADDSSVDEYLPRDQDVDDYTRLISVIRTPRLRDLKEFASGLSAEFKWMDPDLKTRVVERPGGSGFLVDYLLTATVPEPMLEYDLFRIEGDDKKTVLYQHVRRVYRPTAEQAREFRGSIEEGRARWEKALVEARLPIPELQSGRP